MCFYNDYDWYADICTIEDTHNWRHGNRCCECGRVMRLGEQVRTIDMVEREYCSECDGDDQDCEHDYGETWYGIQCEICTRFLAAIKAVEIEEGCSENVSQPPIGALWDTLHEGDFEVKAYLAKAEEMFPGYQFRELVGRFCRMASDD